MFPCFARYFRARVSSYTSGTVSMVTEFRKDAISGLGVNAVINNANNSASRLPSAEVGPTSSATGATTKARVKSAATTNSTSVKASAGRLSEIHLCNTSAALKFLKFYNKARAPTVGTDTPTATYPITANGGRVDIVSILGISFATGIASAIAVAVAGADATATAVDEVTGELLYA